MNYKNYLDTKKGLLVKNNYSTTPLKVSGALLLSLAAVQTDAAVIITNVPPANQLITNGIFPVNVDGVGGAEFNLTVVSGFSFNSRRIYLGSLAPGAQFQGDGGVNFAYPYKLAGGAVVNSVGMRGAGAMANSITYSGNFGNWNNDPSVGYIGFRFTVGADVHYGWIELSVVDGNPGPNSLTVTRWAYENTPNTPILTPIVIALPVSLVNFQGQSFHGMNVLNWQTQAEEHSAGFEIQRSTDGVHFTKIGYVASEGNSTETKSYQYNDRDIDAKINYYRLKLIDIDQQFSFSDIVKVISTDGKTEGIMLHQNPIRNKQLDFTYKSSQEGNLQINLFDVNGKIVHQQASAVSAGATTFTIRLDQLTQGVYFLKCTQGSTSSYEKVILQ